MRLKQIKLAGFKSFVDPTKIPFLNPLSAVIGPNGCGKSNIIDAVRWVLGESSAKHLRGDSMSDVIFNGSTARRPVSVASVELLFENLEGRLSGQYASYQEIAVKRHVTRDGDSQYYLNGQKCRRRDVTDLFMGTGLGPRSYAIIEQGTISRLIESKPQELRVFIEEAAGISRYKERRRETENRIRHTRENLERLGDIRIELGQQLERLAKQSQTAMQYRALRQTERQYDAEVLVERYQALVTQTQALDAEISTLETQKASHGAQRQALELKLTNVVGQLQTFERQEQAQVESFYNTKTHIVELEQALKHQQHEHNSLNDRLTNLSQQLENQQLKLKEQEAKKSFFVGELSAKQPNKAKIDETLLKLQADKQQVRGRLTRINEQLELHNQKVSTARLALDMTRNKHQLLESHIPKSQQQAAELTSQLALTAEKLSSIKANDLASKIKQLDEKTLQQQLKNSQLTTEIEGLNQSISTVKQQEQLLSSQLAEQQGRLAIVAKLLPKASEQSQALWQVVEVTPGWEASAELLLSGLLALPVVTENALSRTQLGDNEIGFISTHKRQTFSAENLGLDIISSPVNLAPWLSHIHWCETVNQAMIERQNLLSSQLIATKDGYLVGHDFVIQKTMANDSLVQLKHEKSTLVAEISSTKIALEQHRQALSEKQAQLVILNEQLKADLQSLQAMHVEQASLTSLLLAQKQESTELNTRNQQLTEKLSQVTTELKQFEAELNELIKAQVDLESQLQLALSDKQVCEGKREQNQSLEKQLQFELDTLLSEQKLADKSQQSLQTQLALCEQQIEQYQQRILELQHEQAQLCQQRDRKNQSADKHTALSLDTQLSQALNKQNAQQQALAQLRSELAQVQQVQEKLGVERKQQLSNIERLTQKISTLKLRCEGLKGQADSQYQTMAEQNLNIESVLASLDPAKSIQWRQKELTRLRAEIGALGAINLAAITEYEQQSERKRYLDSQDADLTAALASLDEAIRKIDRETKSRFKETFDKVNQDLGLLFPKVFGGGSAQLALTSDDLLETGVSIMARPPGKKNSTIHLLSGGEKALTALSLVFAIFRLNPAPFCLLDEVDAPLDDANVERFCRLVKEMSQSVQFIFISHNKITMEMADQLIGVTMHEPGVSRVVAVDIDEAVALADVE